MRLRCSPPTPCGLKGRRALVATDPRLAPEIVDPVETVVATWDHLAVNPVVIVPPPVLRIVVPAETVDAMPVRHAVNPGLIDDCVQVDFR